MEETREIITGTVKNIVFRSADTGWTVLDLEIDGYCDTVVGKLQGISVGDVVEITGRYVVHETYGQQFKADYYVKTLPTGTAAIMRYLSSGVIKGIGPATAKRIVQYFGDRTFELMENKPEELAKIKGINLKRALEISKEIRGRKSLRELCLKLSKFGLTPDDTVNVFSVLGENAAEMIEENPYVLCKAELGFDFSRIDEMALGLNFSEDSNERIAAGVNYVIRHNLLNGHTCLPKPKVIAVTKELLSSQERAVDDACEMLIYSKEIERIYIDGEEFLAPSDVFCHEKYIANRLTVELSLATTAKKVTPLEIKNAEKKLGLELEELQQEAVMAAVSNGIFILTGGPGTGKTTTVKSIIEVFLNRNLKVALAAPTGRAAKRMSELTGKEAKTIHRLLEVGTSDDGKSHIFVRNERNPLDADVIIVDEMSMVDVSLFDALLKATKMGTHLVLVGDSDQLPSVGAGNVLKDLIDSKMFKVICLKKVFRQALESNIIVNAHRIISGQEIVLDKLKGDFFLLPEVSPYNAQKTVIDLCVRRLPEAYGFTPKDDIQILCPSKKLELGTVSINNLMQEKLNPSSEDKPEIAFRGFVLRLGDKVMQIKNNYDIVWTDDDGNIGSGVFNGDVGILEEIDVESRVAKVRFLDKVAEYIGDQIAQLELAYAVTVHKSQGNEFDCVVLPLLDFPFQLKYRNLLYTAVTRAKKLLIIVGSKKVLEQMAANDRKTLRYTALKALLG